MNKRAYKGKNGYCTHIGNEQFGYFASTDSKSRINFLTLLRARYKDYVINDEALSYIEQRLHANKAELLLVFDRPNLPLHNDLSENDIREYVKKHKISGCRTASVHCIIITTPEQRGVKSVQ